MTIEMSVEEKALYVNKSSVTPEEKALWGVINEIEAA